MAKNSFTDLISLKNYFALAAYPSPIDEVTAAAILQINIEQAAHFLATVKQLRVKMAKSHLPRLKQAAIDNLYNVELLNQLGLISVRASTGLVNALYTGMEISTGYKLDTGNIDPLRFTEKLESINWKNAVNIAAATRAELALIYEALGVFNRTLPLEANDHFRNQAIAYLDEIGFRSDIISNAFGQGAAAATEPQKDAIRSVLAQRYGAPTAKKLIS